MDIKVVRELTKLMRDNDLVELEVESSDIKVRLTKQRQGGEVVQMVQAAAPAVPAPTPAAAAAAAAPAVEDLSHCKEITSPVPGTVYLRPNPDAPTYVDAGGAVSDGQVVCLVEAMKVFNEIKSEGVTGTVKKICVQEGQAVEYGTVLFLVG
ncbi:MAG: acetyl-CoA carboxylase biotin carboxyl carrier protein [Planctomycetota bacterium]|nr:MAG: acetyl-CoA carboxylase biotin carboxyl carrier protein [Planctomycetota bacterium]